MGANESQISNESKEFLNTLNKIKCVKDKRFYNGTIYQDVLNKYYLSCNRYSFNKEDNEKLRNLIDQRIKLNHPNLCQFKLNNYNIENNWCSENYKTDLISEFYDQNLETETNNLKRLPDDVDEQKFIPEPDLWYLISILTKLVYDLKQYDMYHGDIQPMNILIDNQDRIKLLETSLLNHSFSGFERMINDPNYYTTLSPEYLKLLKNIRSNNTKLSKIDREKSDMFSIGLTVLALGVNDYITQFYDFENFEIFYEKFKEDFEFMEGLGYSNELLKTLKCLLEVNPEDRYSSSELLSHINRNKLI